MSTSLIINENLVIPGDELRFRFSRSAGPGGQHVNKVETRAELIFNVLKSKVLTSEQKQRLVVIAGRKIDASGNLVLSSQQDRSRSANIEIVRMSLQKLVLAALLKPKLRTKTKIPAAAKAARVSIKKIRAKVKSGRGRIRLENDDEVEF